MPTSSTSHRASESLLSRSASREHKSSCLQAFRESDFEASREEVRAGADSSTSVLFPRPSSDQPDVTIKDAIRTMESSIIHVAASAQLPSSIPEEDLAVVSDELPISLIPLVTDTVLDEKMISVLPQILDRELLTQPPLEPLPEEPVILAPEFESEFLSYLK